MGMSSRFLCGAVEVFGCIPGERLDNLKHDDIRPEPVDEILTDIAISIVHDEDGAEAGAEEWNEFGGERVTDQKECFGRCRPRLDHLRGEHASLRREIGDRSLPARSSK